MKTRNREEGPPPYKKFKLSKPPTKLRVCMFCKKNAVEMFYYPCLCQITCEECFLKIRTSTCRACKAQVCQAFVLPQSH